MSPTARRLLVVSNRLPIVLEKKETGWTLKSGSGGLVSALAPVLSHRGGLWIGWPGLALEKGGDWEAVLSGGYRERGYDLAPVLLSAEEVHGFYEGFSNGILWPLFHDLLGRCDFQPSYWYTYLEVNRKFAECAVEHSQDDDFIWVQDYQLIHVAHFMRELTGGEARKSGFFLHIPFPPLDIFLKLPWRGEILNALLAYDLIGFQTARDSRNFLTCLAQLMPGVKTCGDGPLAAAHVGNRVVHVGAFPIGIDYKSFEDIALTEEVSRRTEELRRKMGPSPLIIGVDRLDYTKGLPERLEAYRNMLRRYPEMREKAIFLQVVVPSREGVPEYQALKAHIERLVGEINGEFTMAGWVPIHYHYKSLGRRDLVALYRLARIGFVTSIKDGMNLVAKEFCACQVDKCGVLVLSEFAGAAAQLQDGALLVNPHDIEGMADALETGLTMDTDERRRRMEIMQEVLREQDIFWWVDNYLHAALGEVPDDFRQPKEYMPPVELEESLLEEA